MADLITLVDTTTVKKSGSDPFIQLLIEAIDVSSYDSIDFQVALISQTGAAASPFGKVTILTSMQNKNDDGSWLVAGAVDLTYSGTLVTPCWFALPIPESGKSLFRYVRYQIEFLSTTTQVSFSLTGLARRGVRL